MNDSSLPDVVNAFLSEQERKRAEELHLKEEDARLRREAERKVSAQHPKEKPKRDWSEVPQNQFRDALIEEFGSSMGL